MLGELKLLLAQTTSTGQLSNSVPEKGWTHWMDRSKLALRSLLVTLSISAPLSCCLTVFFFFGICCTTTKQTKKKLRLIRAWIAHFLFLFMIIGYLIVVTIVQGIAAGNKLPEPFKGFFESIYEVTVIG